MQFDGSEDFWSQARTTYWVKNATDPSGPLLNGGYYRTTSEYFTFLTVPKAGHFVPNNYYSASFQFITDYINSQQLECH